jgi:hypothetical protein
MAAGIPIFAYDDPRINIIYAEVPAFRVARWKNIKEDLHQYIGELADHPLACERLGRIARQGHMTTYSWRSQFAKVEQII